MSVLVFCKKGILVTMHITVDIYNNVNIITTIIAIIISINITIIVTNLMTITDHPFFFLYTLPPYHQHHTHTVGQLDIYWDTYYT